MGAPTYIIEPELPRERQALRVFAGTSHDLAAEPNRDMPGVLILRQARDADIAKTLVVSLSKHEGSEA
jgi:hypothetical protein